MSKQCPYEVLGIEREATSDEISRAYKALAKKHHPDRHATKGDDERQRHAEAFKSISDAHDILSNPEKRKAYDMYGSAAASSTIDEVAAQAIFDQMFGVGASAPKKPRGALGGAMFWDAERQAFFQRRSEDVERLHREMTEGLPEPSVRKDGAAHEASAPLPCGTWEVRWVETDEAEATVRVTLAATDVAGADVDAEATSRQRVLHVCRTFALPSDACLNPCHIDVAVDNSAGAMTVRAAIKRSVAATQETSEAHTSAIDMDHDDDDTEATPPSTPPPTPVSSPPRVHRHKARIKGRGSTLRAGFLNSTPFKPRRIDFGARAGGVSPMEVDEPSKENAHEALNGAIRTQLDGRGVGAA